jgi:uncharacterized damage-inducible protein DinB
MNPEKLIPYFERTHWVIKRQTDGLSHADSLLKSPGWDNCMNWVLGHIVHYRDVTLDLLGEGPSLSQEETEVYRRESEPLTDEEKAVPLSRLLAALDLSHEKLITLLREVSAETLAEIHDAERQQSVGDRIEFIHWHETYHVGQLEILRQLAGKNDRII